MAEDKRKYWFVGASWNNLDKTSEFIEQGIWQNGYEDKFTDKVNSMNPGDFIAIKSSFTRKRDLPFSNPLEKTASVMKIKAVGKVVDNMEDGRTVKVDWDTTEEKEWFFYTGRSTVWEVKPDNWMAQALIDFTFSGKKQDYESFRMDPYWKDRFTEGKAAQDHFLWTAFYEEFADRLLEYKNNRTELLNKIHSLSKELGKLAPLNDHYRDGGYGPVKDICPFTVFGLFNRQITLENRVSIAGALASFLGVKTEVPASFEGVPLVNNQKTWFFDYEKSREPEDIDILWETFEEALKLADSLTENTIIFTEQYDKCTNIRNVGWNLTLGLFWIRPWSFPPLDSRSRDYIKKELGLNIKSNGVKRRCSGEDYLDLCEELETLFAKGESQVYSYPKLSLTALDKPSVVKKVSPVPEMVYDPKNIIFFGPPGTGKTYNTINTSLELILGRDNIPKEREEQKELYDRLVKNRQIEFTTFHQSLSYEDFIEGIKPKVHGDNVVYNVEDGIFKKISQRAEENWLKSQSDEEVTFYKLWEKLIEPLINEDVTKSEEVKIPVKTPRSEFYIYGVTDSTIRFEKANGSRIHTLCISSLHKYYKEPERIKTLGGLKTYYQALVDHLKAMKVSGKTVREELKQFVFIVDEINRGNVASVFGELITLLEPDKRAGMKEALSVKLPYSGDEFSVPPNLHIIGTMNSADRSVEALDSALRRRFSFLEIMPEPELLCGVEFEELETDIDLTLMLETINDRIVRLKDRDHSIGHSYFYSLIGKSGVTAVREELIHIFKNKIIPLLEEYFYGDREKTGMILGASFVEKENKKVRFAKGFNEEPGDPVYTITSPDKWKFQSVYE